MVIKASLHRQIDGLMEDLASDRQVAVESAVARLIVIGGRAVARLTALLDSLEASPASRIAALQALEAIADPRGLDAVLRAVDQADPDLAPAATRVARPFLRGPRGATVVDCLTAAALDRGRHEAVRVAAVRALSDLDPATVQPLIEALEDDPSEALRGVARAALPFTGTARKARPAPALALERGLPDDPAVFRHSIAAEGSRLPLPLLHGLIERIRAREAEEAGSARAEWTAARASAHVALADRGSRLALYDLRETLETARGPLPVEFLSALTAVGDESCLEPIAGAFARAPRSGARKDWWHRHLAAAFQAIVRRERITRRHRVMRKIERRWNDAFRELWPGRP